MTLQEFDILSLNAAADFDVTLSLLWECMNSEVTLTEEP